MDSSIRGIKNQMLQGTWNRDKDTKRKMAMLQLAPQVELLYKEEQNVPALDQYIFKQTIEETLNLSTPVLTHWIFKAKNRIQRAKRRTAFVFRLTKLTHILKTITS
jgi:hypothetical protein